MCRCVVDLTVNGIHQAINSISHHVHVVGKIVRITVKVTILALIVHRELQEHRRAAGGFLELYHYRCVIEKICPAILVSEFFCFVPFNPHSSPLNVYFAFPVGQGVLVVELNCDDAFMVCRHAIHLQSKPERISEIWLLD